METPLEKYIKKTFREQKKQAKMWKDLESFGHKTPSGGTVWTGRDLQRYFDRMCKKHPKRFMKG